MPHRHTEVTNKRDLLLDHDVEKREENLDSGLFFYEYHDRKRDPEPKEEGKREELVSDLFGYSGYDHFEEGKREKLDSDLFFYAYD
jgi:hypothetical protein